MQGVYYSMACSQQTSGDYTSGDILSMFVCFTVTFYNLIEITSWRTKLSSWRWQTGTSGWCSSGWCCHPQGLTGCRNGLTGTAGTPTSRGAKSYTWGGTTPCTNMCFGPPSQHCSFSEKVWELLVATKWNTIHQCVSLLQRRPKGTLGCIRQCCQQVEGDDSSLQHCCGHTQSPVSSSGSSVQVDKDLLERVYGHTGRSLGNGQEDN